MCKPVESACYFFFFFNDTATTEIYTLSLHDALPIGPPPGRSAAARTGTGTGWSRSLAASGRGQDGLAGGRASLLPGRADGERHPARFQHRLEYRSGRHAVACPRCAWPVQVQSLLRQPVPAVHHERAVHRALLAGPPVLEQYMVTGDRPQQAAQLAGHARTLQPRVSIGQVAGERQLSAGDLVLGDDRRGPAVRGEQLGDADPGRPADRVEYYCPAGR